MAPNSTAIAVASRFRASASSAPSIAIAHSSTCAAHKPRVMRRQGPKKPRSTVHARKYPKVHSSARDRGQRGARPASVTSNEQVFGVSVLLQVTGSVVSSSRRPGNFSTAMAAGLAGSQVTAPLPNGAVISTAVAARSSPAGGAGQSRSGCGVTCTLREQLTSGVSASWHTTAVSEIWSAAEPRGGTPIDGGRHVMELEAPVMPPAVVTTAVVLPASSSTSAALTSMSASQLRVGAAHAGLGCHPAARPLSHAG